MATLGSHKLETQAIRLGQSTYEGAAEDVVGELSVEGTYSYNDSTDDKGQDIIAAEYIPWDENSTDTYVFSTSNYGGMALTKRSYNIATDNTRTVNWESMYLTDEDLLDKSSGTPDDMGYYQFWPDLLPKATASTLGAVKVGDNLSMGDDGTLSWDAAEFQNDFIRKLGVVETSAYEFTHTAFVNLVSDTGLSGVILDGSFMLADSYTEDQTFGDATLKVGARYPLVSGYPHWMGTPIEAGSTWVSCIPGATTALAVYGSVMIGMFRVAVSEIGTLPALRFELRLL